MKINYSPFNKHIIKLRLNFVNVEIIKDVMEVRMFKKSILYIERRLKSEQKKKKGTQKEVIRFNFGH